MNTENKFNADYILYAGINNLFRSKTLFKDIFKKAISNNYSKVLPAYEEKHSIWLDEEKKLSRIDEGTIPSDFKKGYLIGLSGLGTIYNVEDLVYENSDRLTVTVLCKNQLSLIDLKFLDGSDIAKKMLKKMDQSKLNIVIVGLGNISKTYIECIKKNKYAKLVAVCDISKKKLNEIKLQELILKLILQSKIN